MSRQAEKKAPKKADAPKAHESVWHALAASDAEAASMRLRADLMVALRDRVEGWDVTQAEAARRLGISQPRLNDLLKGRIEKFSMDMLVKLGTRAGFRVEMKLRKAA